MATWQEKCFKIMEALDWTQRKFARRLSLPPSTLGHYLNGETELPLDVAIRIADTLGVGMDALYVDTNDIDVTMLVVPALPNRELRIRRKVRDTVLKRQRGRQRQPDAHRPKKARGKD